ncbi:hypothetical protein BB560_001335 [Smittium megazygosporum]|uniref:Uncharacterized protein n=1 Tax=Smittium megazygosporum TaxID=133381 RepID=A0A2T9ZHT1_9FUNG|nr:hypothetical protein BB560_001335 [Smittium megazygosporum]
MANAFTLFISTNKVRMWPNGPPPIVERTFGPSNIQNCSSTVKNSKKNTRAKTKIAVDRYYCRALSALYLRNSD